MIHGDNPTFGQSRSFTLTDEKLEDYLFELTAPFPSEYIKWRVDKKISNGNQKVIAYTDARTIFKRLDDVVPGKWDYYISNPEYFEIKHLNNPNKLLSVGWKVTATLSILGVSRSEVGTSSITIKETGKDTYGKEKTESDVTKNYLNEMAQLDPKTAATDATKRVAMAFGIGRYIWKNTEPVYVPGDVTSDVGKAVSKADYEKLYKLGLDYQIKPKLKTQLDQDALLYLLKKIKENPESVDSLIKSVYSNGIGVIRALYKQMLEAK